MNVKKEIPTGRMIERASSGTSIPTNAKRLFVDVTKKSKYLKYPSSATFPATAAATRSFRVRRSLRRWIAWAKSWFQTVEAASKKTKRQSHAL